jgi:hypothetical protein
MSIELQHSNSNSSSGSLRDKLGGNNRSNNGTNGKPPVITFSPSPNASEPFFMFSDHIKEPVVFDSLKFVFDPWILVLQLLIHIFNPVFNCLTNPRVQKLHFTGTFSDFHNPLSSMALVAMFVSYAFVSAKNKHIVNGAIEIPLLLFLVHKILVAVRYASLSKVEYQRIMQADGELGKKYVAQTELITGWMLRAPGVAEFHILSSSLLLGINIAQLMFTVPNPDISEEADMTFRQWKQMVQCCYDKEYYQHNSKKHKSDDGSTPGLKRLPNGSYLACGYHAALGIVNVADRERNNYYLFSGTPTFLISVLNALIPFLAHLGAMGRISAAEIVFFICVTYLNLLYYPTLINFLLVAVLDVQRQKLIGDIVLSMVRLTDYALEDPDEAEQKYTETKPHAMASQARAMVFNSFNSGANKSTKDGNPKSVDVHQDTIGDSVNPMLNLQNRKQRSSTAGDSADRTVSLDTPDSSYYAVKQSNSRLRSAELNAFIDEGTLEVSIGQVLRSEKSSKSLHESSLLSATRMTNRDLNNNEGTADDMNEIPENAQEHVSQMLSVPRIDVTFCNNITSWVYVGQTLHDFGGRFRTRIGIFIGKLTY